MVYNVDINANNKKILNIALDRNSNNSAATVAMVKEIHPFTTNNIYRKYFEEVYDFTDANLYVLSRTSSGVVFNSLDSITGNPGRDMGIPNRTIDDIKKDGLDIINYAVTFSLPTVTTKYTLCIVFYHWRNRTFTIIKKDSNKRSTLLSLYYHTTGDTVNLVVNKIRKQFVMPSNFNGKKIVIWLAENVSSNVTKAVISDYSSTLTIPAARYTIDQDFEFTSEGGVLFSPNFYDTDSEQYHKVILQEKLNGSYIV